jgi:uncharacterized OB-fold protein
MKQTKPKHHCLMVPRTYRGNAGPHRCRVCGKRSAPKRDATPPPAFSPQEWYLKHGFGVVIRRVTPLYRGRPVEVRIGIAPRLKPITHS